MFEVKRYIGGALRNQEHDLVKSVCVADLVKDVWVLASHVGNNNVGLIDLIKDTIQHPLDENLLVHSLCIRIRILSGTFDAKCVDIGKALLKGH